MKKQLFSEKGPSEKKGGEEDKDGLEIRKND